MGQWDRLRAVVLFYFLVRFSFAPYLAAKESRNVSMFDERSAWRLRMSAWRLLSASYKCEYLISSQWSVCEMCGGTVSKKRGFIKVNWICSRMNSRFSSSSLQEPPQLLFLLSYDVCLWKSESTALGKGKYTNTRADLFYIVGCEPVLRFYLSLHWVTPSRLWPGYLPKSHNTYRILALLFLNRFKG